MIQFCAFFVLLGSPLLTQQPDPGAEDTAAQESSVVPDQGEMQKVAEALVKALDTSDGEAFLDLVYTLEEYPEGDLQWLVEGDEVKTREEIRPTFEEAQKVARAEFEEEAKVLHTGWPVLPQGGLTLHRVRSIRAMAAALPEDSSTWDFEQADLADRAKGLYGAQDLCLLEVEAAYPGSDPLLFRLEMSVDKAPKRLVVLGYDADWKELPGPAVKRFVDKAASAMVLGKMADLESLLVQEDDVTWFMEHRASVKVTESMKSEVLVLSLESMTERYHLLREPLEMAGLDFASSIVDLEIEVLRAHSLGATEIVDFTVVADYGERGTRRVTFSVEVMHAGADFKIPAGADIVCRLIPAKFDTKNPLDSAARTALKIMGRPEIIQSGRPGFESKTERILKNAPAFLEGCELLSVPSQIKGLMLIAGAHVDSQAEKGADGDIGPILTASKYYDRAHKLKLKVDSLTWPQVRTLIDGHESAQRLQSIAIQCLEAANAGQQSGADARLVAQCYEAAAIAGSWYHTGSGTDGWGTFAESARRAAEYYMQEAEADSAFDLLRRFFPVDSEGMPSAQKLSQLNGLSMPMLQDGYQRMGILLFNQAADMYGELENSSRARPALKIRTRQRFQVAKQAFVVANQAADGSPYDAFIEQCDGVIGQLSSR